MIKDTIISVRNKITHLMYTYLLKPIFFRIDPEKVHDHMIKNGIFLGSHVVTRKVIAGLYGYSHKKLEQDILGIHFANPIGLSAGFDKDAVLTDILPSVGFGFAEVGSITGEPCLGNPKPRLWRLTESKSLVVCYGLKNRGCEEISARLRGKNFRIPIGISVAKTNCPETVEVIAGIKDYVKALRAFTDIGSYYTINISCPNAYGGQPFTEAKKLDLLLKEVDKLKIDKPIFLKLSADLSKTEVDALLAVVEKHRIHGFICTNLTKNRNNPHIKEVLIPEKGGMSGKIVEDLANELIKYIFAKTGRKYVIIGCGGVFTAEDAYKKIKRGASLIQLITGMVFEGPQTMSEINQGLVRLLERDGYGNISEAVGVDNK